RARFWREEGLWHQEVQATGPSLELVTYDLSELDSAAQAARLEAAIQELQRTRDLRRDSMLRAGFFRMGGDAPNLLFLDIHHLMVDGVSWRILSDDLTTAREQLLAGQPARLPGRGTSFRARAMRLQQG